MIARCFAVDHRRVNIDSQSFSFRILFRFHSFQPRAISDHCQPEKQDRREPASKFEQVKI